MPIVTIVKPAAGGLGLGFLDGRAVFVPSSDVGETLEIELVEEHADYARGAITRIIAPSDNRIEPECPNFGTCGGCDYLHITYEAEIAHKKTIALDCLRRLGRFAPEALPVLEVEHGPRAGYRSHAELASDGVSLGFFARRSHRTVPLPPDGCRLLAEPINRALASLAPPPPGALKIALDAEGYVRRAPFDSVVREHENGICYRRSLQGFFQANRHLRGRMIEIVRTHAHAVPEAPFADVYCGVGFFSVALALAGMRGEGFDGDAEAVRWARANASDNECAEIEFFSRSADSIAPAALSGRTVIVDPPRAGLSKRFRRTLAASGAPRIIYVSCDPATFARDASAFAAAGFRFAAHTLIDMFPATAHIEQIALFESA
ncbi:MAG TPA: methyltransferase [Spirochaetota bacterium]|nr:methyltransferase [Spirochaetota bacterium]HNT10852.1 methyltransferase [Spirochaetota bacterium]